MSSGGDLREVMMAAHDDQTRGVLDRFVEEYVRSRVEGWDDTPLGEAEQRLGIRLPPTVRRWLETYGRTAGVADGQDATFAPDQWELHEGRLRLRHENQFNWHIDVELEGDDPEVWVRTLDGRQELITKTFSEYALQLAVYETVMTGGAHGRSGAGVGDEGFVEWIGVRLGAPALPPWPSIIGCASFYSSEQCLAVVYDEPMQPPFVTLTGVSDEFAMLLEREAPMLEWTLPPQ